MRYVRGRVGEIIEEPDKSLRVRFEDTMTGTQERGARSTSSCSRPAWRRSKGTQDIARVAGVQTAAAGFISEFHPKLAPVDTQRTGMFLARHRAGAEDHPRLDRPGQGGGGPRHQHAEHGLRDDAGAGRLERPGRLHRLRRAARRPARRAP